MHILLLLGSAAFSRAEFLKELRPRFYSHERLKNRPRARFDHERGRLRMTSDPSAWAEDLDKGRAAE